LFKVKEGVDSPGGFLRSGVSPMASTRQFWAEIEMSCLVMIGGYEKKGGKTNSVVPTAEIRDRLNTQYK